MLRIRQLEEVGRETSYCIPMSESLKTAFADSQDFKVWDDFCRSFKFFGRLTQRQGASFIEKEVLELARLTEALEHR